MGRPVGRYWLVAGAPLTAALLRAGNLPAAERNENTASRDRIAEAFGWVAVALLDWVQPDERSDQ